MKKTEATEGANATYQKLHEEHVPTKNGFGKSLKFVCTLAHLWKRKGVALNLKRLKYFIAFGNGWFSSHRANIDFTLLLNEIHYVRFRTNNMLGVDMMNCRILVSSLVNRHHFQSQANKCTLRCIHIFNAIAKWNLPPWRQTTKHK